MKFGYFRFCDIREKYDKIECYVMGIYFSFKYFYYFFGIGF